MSYPAHFLFQKARNFISLRHLTQHCLHRHVSHVIRRESRILRSVDVIKPIHSFPSELHGFNGAADSERNQCHCCYAPPQKDGWIPYPVPYCPLQISDSETTSPSLQSSIILWLTTAALSLIPSNAFRYVTLGIAVVSLGIYAAHLNRPSARLEALKCKIKVVADILDRTMSEYPRNYDLDGILSDFLQTKLSASRIQSDLLEADDASWKNYLQSMKAIWRELNQCEKQARKIRTLTLLAIESETRRQLARDIEESRDTISKFQRRIGPSVDSLRYDWYRSLGGNGLFNSSIGASPSTNTSGSQTMTTSQGMATDAPVH
ncbi:hypothetical protein B0H19DRAFT_1317343 [Mycena capillaripes]|nr:hypothetical protein B0H19DRAFT_1317343 [Mycena capillaripes]